MNDHNLIQFAYNLKKERISIFDVPTGINTGCFCRLCGNSLGAKNKNKTRETIIKQNQKSAHFYHPPESNCKGETLVHIMAKEVLMKTKKLLFEITYNNQNGKKIKTSSEIIEFDSIILEKTIDINSNKWIRPDAVAIIDEKKLYIEFAYTSFIKDEKEALIKSKNLNVIEINLNTTNIDWNDYQDEISLEKKVTEFLASENISSFNWINNYNLHSILTKVIDNSAAELKLEKKIEEKRLAKEYDEQMMEIKKEMLCDVLELGSTSRVLPVLQFEEITHFLSDEHFLIENNEISIIESTLQELLYLKETCWRDWQNIARGISFF
jgi:hypothetical protein